MFGNPTQAIDQLTFDALLHNSVLAGKSMVIFMGDEIDFSTVHTQPLCSSAVWLAAVGSAGPPFKALSIPNFRALITALTGAHVATPAASIGTNGAAFNNFSQSQTYAAATLNTLFANGVTGATPALRNDGLVFATSSLLPKPLMDGTVPTVNVTVACTAGQTFKAKPIFVGWLYDP